MIEGNFVGIRRSGYKARRSEKFVGYKRGNLAYVQRNGEVYNG